MNQRIFFLGTFLIVLATSPTLQASEPAIEGQVSGIELCPQFICGNALFTGVYLGEVEGAPALGTWFAAINHQPLPELGEDAVAINGGEWSLRTWVFRGFFPARKRFSGDFGVGTLRAEPGNFYRALVPMTITSGGSGPIDLDLLLDENSLPQPVNGTLTQPTAK